MAIQSVERRTSRRGRPISGKETVGSFSVSCTVENIIRRDRQASIAKMLVDTGSEYTWLPDEVLSGIGIRREKKDVQFVMANGTTITRGVGFAIIRIGERFTVDEVVFAEPGDLALLGARTLEGLSLVVDPRRKKLVAAGPIPAA
jgi:predicted aspartyl protease